MFFFFTLPSEFQVIISGSKKQQQKDSYQSEVPFSVIPGRTPWKQSMTRKLQIWHENNSDASLKKEKGLNSRHREIFGYVIKEYFMH